MISCCDTHGGAVATLAKSLIGQGFAASQQPVGVPVGVGATRVPRQGPHQEGYPAVRPSSSRRFAISWLVRQSATECRRVANRDISGIFAGRSFLRMIPDQPRCLQAGVQRAEIVEMEVVPTWSSSDAGTPAASAAAWKMPACGFAIPTARALSVSRKNAPPPVSRRSALPLVRGHERKASAQPRQCRPDILEEFNFLPGG